MQVLHGKQSLNPSRFHFSGCEPQYITISLLTGHSEGNLRKLCNLRFDQLNNKKISDFLSRIFIELQLHQTNESFKTFWKIIKKQEASCYEESVTKKQWFERKWVKTLYSCRKSHEATATQTHVFTLRSSSNLTTKFLTIFLNWPEV